MKKIKPGKMGALKRAFKSSVTTSFARALRLISSKPLAESNSQVVSDESTEPYMPYDDLRRTRIQMVDLERRRAEATDLVRRRTYA